MKYSDIKDLEGIAAARAEIAHKLDRKSKELVSKYEITRDFYTPSGIFAHGLKNISKSIPVDRIILLLVRMLKRKIKGA